MELGGSNLAAIFKTGPATPGGGVAAPAANPTQTTGSRMNDVNPNAGKGTVDNPGNSLDGVLNPPGTNADGTPKTTEPSSPLDAFADVFKIDPNAKPKADPLSEKLLSLDPAKLAASVTKMDFSRSLNPELVQKALSGDAASFSAALNQVTQSAFAASTQMVVNLMEQAFAKNNSRFDSVLGDRIRNANLAYTKPTNEALTHPAAQPVLAAMKAQIANQMPHLSPTDVASKAEEYFLAMADAVTSKKPAPAPKPGDRLPRQEQDWSEFLSM
jgi:hypothetical protein